MQAQLKIVVSEQPIEFGKLPLEAFFAHRNRKGELKIFRKVDCNSYCGLGRDSFPVFMRPRVPVMAVSIPGTIKAEEKVADSPQSAKVEATLDRSLKGAGEQTGWDERYIL